MLESNLWWWGNEPAAVTDSRRQTRRSGLRFYRWESVTSEVAHSVFPGLLLPSLRYTVFGFILVFQKKF